MNNAYTRFTPALISTRLASASLAVMLTLAMLLGVGSLADVDVAAAQWAQSQTAART